MGISIQLYRLRIGTFSPKCSVSSTQESSFSRIRLSFTASFLLIFLLSQQAALPSSYDVEHSVVLRQFLHGHLHPPLHPHGPAHDLHPDTLQCQQQSSPCLNWPYAANSNQLAHSLTGNRRRIGYKLSFWNCRRKLLNQTNKDTNKMIDIKKFVEDNKPHVFGILESDLFSTTSLVNRRNKLTTQEVHERLQIEGYKIELSDTWEEHGQARVVAFISEDIVYKRKNVDPAILDLPNITLEIGLGKEKKTIVNIFFIENGPVVSLDYLTKHLK